MVSGVGWQLYLGPPITIRMVRASLQLPLRLPQFIVASHMSRPDASMGGLRAAINHWLKSESN